MIEASLTRLNLGIAGLGICLDCPDINTYTQLTNEYQDFLWSGISEWHIHVRFGATSAPVDYPGGIHFQGQRLFVAEANGWGWLSTGTKSGELVLGLGSSRASVDYFLRAAFALMAFEAGGLMLHAAGVVKEGRAYCFFGQSGSGKTTIARYSPDGAVLNDDLLLILPAERDWSVHGTPFTNPTQVSPQNLSAPLGGLYHLIQDQEVYIEQLGYAQALAELFSCLPVLSGDFEHSRVLLTRLQTILAKYPVNSLHFRQNMSFWGSIK